MCGTLDLRAGRAASLMRTTSLMGGFMGQARLALLALAGGTSLTLAAEPVDFTGRVAPLLAAKCGACHGPEDAESGFRIDRDHAFAGGDSGAAGIVPGEPAASELFVRISTTTRSADARRRRAAVGRRAAVLKDWIAGGAVWPDDLKTLPASLLPDAEAEARQGGEPLGVSAVRRSRRCPSGRPTATWPAPSMPFSTGGWPSRASAMNPEADPQTLIRRVSLT